MVSGTLQQWQRDGEELVRQRGRPALLWCDAINEQTEQAVYRAMAAPAVLPALDVVLCSDGGDPHAAYRAVNFLRARTISLDVLLPGRAKSAATLIALAADVIWFAHQGELGPLDLQVAHPTRPGEYVSSLDAWKTILELEQSFSGKVIGPLLAQLHPVDLGFYSRAQEVGEEYARRILQRWVYRDRPVEYINFISETLVARYPSHQFVIDLQEARELDLPADLMPADLMPLVQRLAAVQGVRLISGGATLSSKSG